MYYNVESINLKSRFEKKEVEEFLNRFDLKYEAVDYTVVIRENDNIIATCSKKENIVKCFAIDSKYQGLGISNNLISKVTEKLFTEGIYHNFIFTKPENTFLFEGLGYKLICSTDKVALLESGNKNINSFLDSIQKKYKIDSTKEYSSLVMNCNPFTLGHRYIIEQASKESENVIVFVVKEDKSIFPFDTRIRLVREGTADLKNVIVVEGGEYVISSATFPSYFLKQKDDSLEEYTKLDCEIFSKYFVPKFNIVKRYVGTEPNCVVTNTYNKTICKVLPKHNVDVNIVERKKVNSDVISASKVRKILKEFDTRNLEELVPETTFKFLISKEGEFIINKL